MPFPEFFDAAPRITVRDPLARFLGAADDGVIAYGYADVVKLAGHSCPTVASAYLMTRAALGSLYPEALPERGGIRVELRDDRLEGASGVVANVASFVRAPWLTSIRRVREYYYANAYINTCRCRSRPLRRMRINSADCYAGDDIQVQKNRRRLSYSSELFEKACWFHGLRKRTGDD